MFPIAAAPNHSLPHPRRWGRAPSPSPSAAASSTAVDQPPPTPRTTIDFSPPLIAMVVVVAAAFLLVTYSRLITRHLLPRLLHPLRRLSRWHRRRRRRRSQLASSTGGDLEDSLPPFYGSPLGPGDGFHVYSPYGLDESVIKTIPLAVYTAKRDDVFRGEARDCAVCLLEFEEDDYVRTLPVCSHSFHVDCIDMWLRSHANCPLCRAGILRAESPFVPIMSARIRPSLDDTVLRSISLEPLAEAAPEPPSTVAEITPCMEEPSPMRNGGAASEDRVNRRDFLLKRSYSFGFERSLPSERLVLEPATASPWRYRRGGFWSKRPSPFGSLTKPRVFSFRYYRGMKSPFLRRRGFFPLSESSVRFSVGGGSSSRRSKSSPMFLRPGFSSSRLRCGDPEALLSPERFGRR